MVTGADVNQVSNAIGMDNRIGDKFITPGPGFEELFSKRYS